MYRRIGNAHRFRGSAMSLMVIISVIMTGLVMSIAWAAAVQSQTTGAKIHADQAYMAAESVAQVATWQFKNNNSWRQTTVPAQLPTVTLGGNTFSYALTCTDAGATADLCWPMKEGSGSTTADTSGHGNTGTLIGGVSWTSQGRFTNGLLFDGVSGYVDAGNAPSTNIVGSITMCAWVKMNTAAMDQKVGGNQDNVAGGYKMSIYNTKVEFETRDVSNNYSINRYVSGGTILTMGTWYHVAGVYDAVNNTITTYVNGKLDRQATAIEANALSSTAGHLQMGREPWNNGGNTRYFAGYINDVRLYARALSAQEISTLANISVQINASASLQNGGYRYPPTNAVAYICSYPTALPPTAPALTIGGNLTTFQDTTINGDLQVTGNILTPAAACTVNGKVTYGGTYTDPSKLITIKGNPTTAVKNASVTAPTINTASIQALAVSTLSGGTGTAIQFGYLNNQINVIYVNGDLTDPTIDTSVATGTLLINGNLNLTKSATFGSSGFPCYIICTKNVTHSGGTMTLYGGLYVLGNWTHKESNVNGLVSVNGSVTDNTISVGTFTTGAIPWFDSRSLATGAAQPVFYAACRGATP